MEPRHPYTTYITTQFPLLKKEKVNKCLRRPLRIPTVAPHQDGGGKRRMFASWPRLPITRVIISTRTSRYHLKVTNHPCDAVIRQTEFAIGRQTGFAIGGRRKRVGREGGQPMPPPVSAKVPINSSRTGNCDRLSGSRTKTKTETVARVASPLARTAQRFGKPVPTFKAVLLPCVSPSLPPSDRAGAVPRASLFRVHPYYHLRVPRAIIFRVAFFFNIYLLS